MYSFRFGIRHSVWDLIGLNIYPDYTNYIPMNKGLHVLIINVLAEVIRMMSDLYSHHIQVLFLTMLSINLNLRATL